MGGVSYQLRLLAPTALTSLLLLALCGNVAVFLYRQQALTAEALGENIGSRRAAADLEESLEDLAALHRDPLTRVGPVHDRVEEHLEAIRELADKEEERALVARLLAAMDRYRGAWRAAGLAPGAARASGAATARALLVGEVLPACRELQHYNSRQVEESAQVHRQTLRRMAWGLLTVGGVGSFAGLLLGYGVARGLRRSLQELQERLREAADKLGPERCAAPPGAGPGEGRAAPILAPPGGLDQLHEQVREVGRQIERVVQRLRQREREVLRAEQLARVGQLATGIAHEIRNPLTSIKMLAQAGLEEAEAAGVGRGGQAPQHRGLPEEDLRVIEREARRMERSLKTFLDFARPPQLERSLLDLRELVQQTLDLVRGRAARQEVALHFSRPPTPVQAEADGEQLRQVLVNLALNALDEMPRGGRVDFTLRLVGASEVELSVLDSGPGISPALWPRLFEPFVTGKETGLGLGLLVSRRIVEEHGGTLVGENRPEGGARFTLRVPAQPRAPRAEAPWPPSS
jgi:signal transduction histidine kinase